jgi:hypothetical protein
VDQRLVVGGKDENLGLVEHLREALRRFLRELGVPTESHSSMRMMSPGTLVEIANARRIAIPLE